MLKLTIEVEGKTTDDLLLYMEEVVRLVREGYTNTAGYESLSMTITGEEELDEDDEDEVLDEETEQEELDQQEDLWEDFNEAE